MARRRPQIARELPAVLSRGVPVGLRVRVQAPPAVTVRVRQAVPQALALEPREGDGGLEAELLPRRRGRHVVPAVGTRSVGPLRLGAWYARAGDPGEVSVFPDLLTARRLALTVRQGRYRDQGISARGPLGLGTDFELVRDYLPDDDIRQVNWRATARLGRPMSNQYRVEQDRDVMLVLDAGRLSAAPLPAGASGVRPTVLDACLDALTAVALVVDEVGDRCGAIAFDREVRRTLQPGRQGGGEVVRALFDCQPRMVDSDFELAFRRVEGAKRAFVLVLCDLLEEAAARPLVEAIPVLTRRHAVVVASPADPGVAALAARAPAGRGRPGAGGRRGRRAGRPHPRRGARARRRGGVRRGARRPAPAGVRDRLPAREVAREAVRRPPAPGHEAPEQREQRDADRRLHGDGQLGPVRKPSATPQRTSHGTVPIAISTAARASRASARPRADGPGEISAQPIRRPATPPATMHDSSSGPCADTSRRNAVPLPASIASPAMTPRIIPLKTSASSVPTPAAMPPAKAVKVTWMLLIITSVENAALSPAPKSRPDAGGSAAACSSPGTTASAALESDNAHSPAARAGTSSSAQATISGTGRSASRRQ